MYNTKATSNRFLLLLGFLLAAVMLSSGCQASQRPLPTGDPDVINAVANRSKVTVEFAAALNQTQKPTPELFTVEVDGRSVPVKSATVKENIVVLRLQDSVSHNDHVQVSFVNTDTADIQLQTVAQTPIHDFTGLGADNNTDPPKSPWGIVALMFLLVFFLTSILVCT